jgi:hypothetical protein
MKYNLSTHRNGLAPVISSIILAAAVVSIGGALWFYSQGATSVISEGYLDDTFELVNDVAERFTVEYVTNNSDCTTLHIWIYNYGDVNVTTDVYVSTNDTVYTSDIDNPLFIGSSDYVCANITVSVQTGEYVTVKVHSRRQNNAFATYLVP